MSNVKSGSSQTALTCHLRFSIRFEAGSSRTRYLIVPNIASPVTFHPSNVCRGRREVSGDSPRWSLWPRKWK